MSILSKILNQQLLTYLLVGGLTALVYFGFMALCIEVLKLDYHVGVTVAYVLAVSFHFLANRKFTFRVLDKRFIHQSIRYLGVLLINYLITLGVVSFLVDKFGVSTYSSAALSIVITVSIGYVFAKYWVFSSEEYLRD
jgi:putative flippase GtrA